MLNISICKISACLHPMHIPTSAYVRIYLNHPPVYTPGFAHTRCMIIIPDMFHMSIYSGESYENRIYF